MAFLIGIVRLLGGSFWGHPVVENMDFKHFWVDKRHPVVDVVDF